MSLLAPVLPFLKLAAIFTLMLGLIRRKVAIAWAILAGAVLTGVVFWMSPLLWLRTAGGALTEIHTLLLGVIVALILVLSDLLESTGQSERLMRAISGAIHSPRVRLAFFPSLIGLLPMPGGAVFSAPMLEGVAAPLGVGQREKVLLNYWFRHVWEPCWPLYPGIILASTLARVPLVVLATYLIPGTLAALTIGWFLYLSPRVLPLQAEVVEDRTSPPLRVVLTLGAPLLIGIVASLVLQSLISALLPGVPSELGIVLGIAGGIVAAVVQNEGGMELIRRSLTKRSLYKMLALVAAIFVFKDVLANSGAVDELTKAAGAGAALATAAVVLPLVVGFVAGINLAFVGASFPLLLGLLDQLGIQDRMSWIVMAEMSGYVGLMASPIHLCYLLTCEFFGVDIVHAWRKLLPACVLLLGASVIYVLILRAF